jgi:hypothetical protein
VREPPGFTAPPTGCVVILTGVSTVHGTVLLNTLPTMLVTSTV